MKIFIDADAILACADHGSDADGRAAAIEAMTDDPDLGCWVSAATLNSLYNRASGATCPIFPLLSKFAVIPLDHGILTKAVDNRKADFDLAVQLASAETMNMDCIVSDRADQYPDTAIPVYTPAQFIDARKTGSLSADTPIPFMDLKAQHHPVFNEISGRFNDIIANTGFILGKHVDEFEQAFGKRQGSEYCIGVSSGTDALHLALMALDTGPGDLVILPANTFIATAEPVTLCGARPLFVDCDAYFQMDPERLDRLLAGMTKSQRDTVKAIIPVHLYGQAADMDPICEVAKKYRIDIIEDCCQAHLAEYKGKKVGNFGRFGAFSFYPGKNLGAWGEAGALITNDEALFIKAKQLRQHGELKKYQHDRVGHNYRMSALQGAVLSAKIKHLEAWTRQRRARAAEYTKILSTLPGIVPPMERQGCPSVFHLYVIQTDDRDGLARFLETEDIATGMHYPVPLHLQTAYAHLGYKKGEFPCAEEAASRILSLPLYPELTREQVRTVCSAIKRFQTL